MAIAVRSGLVDLDLGVAPGDDRLVGYWSGPASARAKADDGPAGEATMAGRFASALEVPRNFPPLASAVVPGDRVAVALDLDGPAASAAVEALARVLRGVGVEEITVVSPAAPPAKLPPGVTWEVHDPDDRSKIAYLASTTEGRRVYLNRALTDADFVLPIGTLGYDRGLGYRGPWSALYPGLSDRETLTRYRSLADDSPIDRDAPRPSLVEASEVGWLVGCQLQVGVLPGATADAPAEVIAGLETTVREDGTAAVDHAWTFEVAERADVVVVGVGEPGRAAVAIDDLGAALANATKLVRRGGKVVAVAPVDSPIGPALRRLAGAENPRAALNRLRGQEAAPDIVAARQIATTLAWADLYLSSGLDPDAIEDLAIIPLARPEEARKLAASAASLIVLNHAERTRCLVRDDF